MSKKRKKLRVLITMAIAVVFAALGDVSLSRGMKTVGAVETGSIFGLISAAVVNPYVIGGVALLFVFLILYLTSLSWEDLSFVVPLTGADYILVTLFAYLLINEQVSPLRWAGSAFVAVGIALVARS